MRREDIERANDAAHDLAVIEENLSKIEFLRTCVPVYLCNETIRLDVTFRAEVFLDILESIYRRDKADLEHFLEAL